VVRCAHTSCPYSLGLLTLRLHLHSRLHMTNRPWGGVGVREAVVASILKPSNVLLTYKRGMKMRATMLATLTGVFFGAASMMANADIAELDKAACEATECVNENETPGCRI
jgi:hypothetical protein